jgi:hypothetical protein
MSLQKEYTKTGLLSFIGTFFQGSLDIDKAIKLFEMEFGYTPIIIDTEKQGVTDYLFEKYNCPEHFCTEDFEYMYELQQSGATNMFSSGHYIQQALGKSRQEAKEILSFYIEHYEEIYFPENLI